MKLKFRLLMALTVVAALGAVNAASAFAAEEFFAVGGTKLPTSGPPATTMIDGVATETFALGATIATIPVTITCTNAATTGNIRNSATMGEGEAISIVFSGCTVDATGQGCTVKGVTVADPIGTITVSGLKATGLAGRKVEFTPVTSPFVKLELVGCKTAGLNKSYEVTGQATGVEGTAGSGILEFTSTSGSSLKLGGIAATFKGKSSVTHTATGAKVTMVS